MRPRLSTGAFAGVLVLGLTAGHSARAEEMGAMNFSLAYTADVAGALAGDAKQAGRALDNLDLVADLDLERLAGWRGARAHAYVLVNNGGAPNELLGTLEGVDNIEVGRPAARLYEAWIEQDVGATSVLAGLYDLNSEFYATESSGMLIAPPFGIGSELAATGSNGPSIFPSTALAVRLKIAGEQGYVQAAAFNAQAGVPGDPGGVDTSFDDGLLLIAQAGRTAGPWTLSAGAWRYTEDQDDLFDVAPAGGPARRKAQGAYLLVERTLALSGREGAAFLRGGLSDGDTTPFHAAWQAGVLVRPFPAARPEGAFSLGVHQGMLGDKFSAAIAAGGERTADAETGLEVTYADQLTPRLSVQPDIQVIWNPSGLADAKTVVLGALRVTIALGEP